MSELVYVDGKWVKPPDEVAPDKDMVWTGTQWVPKGHDFSVLNMILNTPGSAFDAVVGTAEGLYGLGKAIGTGDTETLAGLPSAIAQHYKDRYGSWDKTKRTLEEDPVGAVFDVPVGPGGAAKLVSRNAGKLGNLAKQTARSGYERQAKFSTTIDKAKRKEMVETGLEEGIYPTPGGVAKLDSLVDKLNADIDRMIGRAQLKGARISIDEVLYPLKELRQKMGSMKLEGSRDLATINSMEKAFRAHARKTGRSYFTPRELQEFKKDLYKRINFDRKTGKGTMAGEEARKAAARGAKEGLEQVEPNVWGINQRLGRLYELQGPLEQASNRLGNRNFMNLRGSLIGGGLGGGAGGLLGGDIFSSLLGAGAMSALMSPGMARGITRGLNKFGDVAQGIPEVPWKAAAYSAIPQTLGMPGRIDDDEDY